MKRLVAVVAAMAVAVSAIVAVAAIGASGPTKPATVKTRTTGKLGKILVDGKSHTLYLFEKDKHGKSACSGACATNWPPLLTKGKPKAGSGASSSKLGTTKRKDGTTQVTYNNHPLYFFKGDNNKVGATKGQNLDAFGAEWYVVGPNGKKVEGHSSSSHY